ncbi:MAG: topoisomerase C-terminal repeat-containing protein, partial [Rubrobacteraceae bacterium]
LVPTGKGRALIRLLGDSRISSPELTARWEERLAKMEHGTETRPDFMADIGDFVRNLVEEARVKEGEKVATPAKRNGKRGASTSKLSGETVGACPNCGAPVVETKKAFGCSAWKQSGCDFVVWKTVAGKRVSEAQAKQLLTKGRTGKLKGFKSKAGKPFEAALVLDETRKVRLEFENRQ